jgi:two-component system CheB/CheR fusion protein
MATTKPLCILLVDDHEASALPLARLLRAEGHVVTTAHTVTGAMVLAAGQRNMDLLISDIDLPDGDGCDLLNRLRTFYCGREVPAIALTGFSDKEMLERCRRAGYGAFLAKPVTFADVLGAIEALRPATTCSGPGGVPAPRI